jgi:hypothetical protein
LPLFPQRHIEAARRGPLHFDRWRAQVLGTAQVRLCSRRDRPDRVLLKLLATADKMGLDGVVAKRSPAPNAAARKKTGAK